MTNKVKMNVAMQISTDDPLPENILEVMQSELAERINQGFREGEILINYVTEKDIEGEARGWFTVTTEFA